MKIVAANGANIPAVGFGTHGMSRDEMLLIIPAALDAGFRHIDTAQIYRNEAEVGECAAASGVARTELFLTTKVWVSNYGRKAFASSVDESLRRLRTDYIDLLLLHWPGGSDVPLADQIGNLNEVMLSGKVRTSVSATSAAPWCRRRSGSRLRAPSRTSSNIIPFWTSPS